MEDLSLHILDISQNSIRAGAREIGITVEEDQHENRLRFTIRDDGCGMTPDQLERLSDPFFTTRTTRRVGLGIPLLKQTAELAGGGVTITSRVGEGTTVTAEYELDHIDRPPLGDVAATIWTLIVLNPQVEFSYRHRVDGDVFEIDTAALKKLMKTKTVNTPKLAAALKQYIREGEERLRRRAAGEVK